MVEVFSVLLISTALAYFYNTISPLRESDCKKTIQLKDYRIHRKENSLSSIVLIFLICYMVWFAGLRTVMNDTAQYILTFNTMVSSSFAAGLKNLDWSIGANPLFNIFRLILKSTVSRSANTFIFISALITVTLMVLFICKYSINFGYSIFIFVAFAVFAFTMAAMKQAMATSIAVWSIPFVMKKQYIRASAIILTAMLIHPYVVLFFAAFFLKDEIWGKKTLILIAATIIAGLSFSEVIGFMVDVTGTIGDKYEENYFESGVSLFRRLVYFVPPVLSFVFKDKLRKEKNELYNLVINLSIVSSLIMFFAGFGGAVLIARLAMYFDIFTCLALPVIVFKGIEDKSIKLMVYYGSFPCYMYYYFVYYSKYTVYGAHFYSRISFLELLDKW